MLLPGSRPRAYDDVSLVLYAAKLLAERIECWFVMAVAPTIERERLLSGLPAEFGRTAHDGIVAGDAKVAVYSGPIAAAAKGADILIGLGGTANQVSAGLGVPVISIIEKGKIVQKKLLQDSEILAPPTPEALCSAAFDLLSDPERLERMAQAGVRILGGPGAVVSVAEYAASALGWDARCRLYEKLSWVLDGSDVEWVENKAVKEEYAWEISKNLRNMTRRSAKIEAGLLRLG
jgi:tetraacyldisaccharide 4'-kinase